MEDAFRQALEAELPTRGIVAEYRQFHEPLALEEGASKDMSSRTSAGVVIPVTFGDPNANMDAAATVAANMINNKIPDDCCNKHIVYTTRRMEPVVADQSNITLFVDFCIANE